MMTALGSDPATNLSRLNDAVFRRLGEEIVMGVLSPGEPLQDRVMAERLGVSRTPVREALFRLERVGLVVIRASRRTLVAPCTNEAVRDGRRWAGHLATIALREAQPRLTTAGRDLCATLAVHVADELAAEQHAASSQFALLSALAEQAESDILREEVREREFSLRRALGVRDDRAGSFAPTRASFLELAVALREGDRRLTVECIDRIYGLGVPID